MIGILTIIEKTGDTGLSAASKLQDVVHEANVLDNECKIDERIEHSDETLLDCMVISSSSSLLKKFVEHVDVFTTNYEQTEFAANIHGTNSTTKTKKTKRDYT
ncbi:unnamed protein product [Acanthoscelides obtectus]|uniref:Uncharacterized protein n=1 Tax=Acanthoscelides obtectus TaxID=200917 RepID=A0A9P0M0R3_ACAOB|nr:unnamed protein product [Acanthoscelides obtectus]CAK1655573.1 hypothetical protein AOBTE_LOCUS19223 [Acanthoscelides obtectus]